MTLPELAIKRPVTTLMVLVSIIVLGLVALARLPLAFMPDITEPELFVNVPYENASPEQVEQMIIRPLEDAVGGVRGLQSIWARCSAEGGRMRLEFSWETDMHLARVEVWERIDRIRGDLPDDIGDIAVSTSWDSRDADTPVMEARLSSPRDLSESYDLLERKIIRPLERVPGVAQVRLDGVNPREVRINLRVADLELHRIDVRDVNLALRSNNFDQSLGKIRSGDHRWTVRTIGTFGSVDEIANLPLRSDGLRVRDVADVIYREPPLEYGRHLDGEFAIGVTVSQESRANTVQVCDALTAEVERMGEDPELQGINFLVWFSQGAEIRKTLRDLTFTGVFGSILASVVLFLFLRRVSTTIVAVACIPFSLIVTCGIVWAQGRSLNTLTLLGLIVGIGMLVDNAVVVMENIFRHRELGADRKTAALKGAKEVTVAVVAATLTSVIVFLPIIFNKPSEMNLYLKELGITVCLTLLASLFISQTLIPMATSWFIRSKPKPRGRFMVWLEDRYERLLAVVLRRRWLSPVIGLVVVASAIFPYQRTDMNFDASRSELFVQVRYNFSEETSLERKEEIVSFVEQTLEPYRQELMARSIYSFWSDRWSLTRVYLEEGEASEENVAAVRVRLRELLPEVAGVRLQVEETGQHWRRHRGRSRVAFQIVGEDTETLMLLAEQAIEHIEQIPGLYDVQTRHAEARQELHIEPDRDLADRYGVSANQVSQVVGLTFRGRRLARFRTPDGEREMRMTLDEQETESVDQLRNLALRTGDGEKVPLAAVAAFNERPGRETIQRHDRRTSVWVMARYRDGTRDDYIPAVEAALGDMTFPYGFEWTFGNWQQLQQEQSREFLENLLLALLLVFALMAGLFESARQAAALMVSLPFAISGAAWTLWATGTSFDQPAAIGLLLLIGIVVNNGIVMLEHINQYRRAGMDRTEAMLKGGRERLRPILMTAVTTLIGLVPIVVQKPSLGGVYYYSMALVIMGGLFVSTFLTSVLLPSTASLSEDMFGWMGRMLGRLLPKRKQTARADS
ncbi:MAG: efflux RND transporter permease subunit [bacterium]|nr:efflux RND transporter permease subunit [bacterium]